LPLWSIRQALLILSIIPFALVGGIVALWLTGEYLSVPASVGFIALLGITVLNGVVLVGYFNQLRHEGMPLREVVVTGAKRRLRPVMMTASITAFGLIPLLFASGPGSEIQRPLAIVVIGGLITATALTLMLLPILYLKFAGADKNPARRSSMSDSIITILCPRNLEEQLRIHCSSRLTSLCLPA
jgi:cobalt-zinc-cadmium resistance protein CzcA